MKCVCSKSKAKTRAKLQVLTEAVDIFICPSSSAYIIVLLSVLTLCLIFASSAAQLKV